MGSWVGVSLVVGAGVYWVLAAFGLGMLRRMPFLRASFVFMGVLFALLGASSLKPAVVGVPWNIGVYGSFACFLALFLAARVRGEYTRRP